jgi:hypothetical protein
MFAQKIGQFPNADSIPTGLGSFKKGDYFVVNYMKASNIDDYVAWEKKAWMPFADAMAKQGTRSGWSLNTIVFPGGADVKFNAVTVDVYPTWDSISTEFNFYGCGRRSILIWS